MSHGKQIAQNAAWLLIATTIQKALAFLSFTVIANLVGVQVTGRYAFAISVTSIFVAFTDLGMTPVVIREIAAGEEEGKRALQTAIRIKWLLIPGAIILALLYAILVRVQWEVFLAIAVACLVMSADAVSLLWYGALRGRRQLRFEAAGMFVGQLFTAGLGVSLAYLGAGVMGLVCALLAGSVWNLAWSVIQARRLGLAQWSQGGWPWKKLMLAALPFALAGICVKVYSNVDSLLLRQFFGEHGVGFYAVAYKVTYAFQFLPLAFVAALYPGMSAAFAAKDTKALRSILDGSLRLMMLISVPLSACLSGLGDKLIRSFYPDFSAGSILPMMILPWVLIPIFLDFPIGSLLNSTHRAAQKTKAMFFTMLVNILMNLCLVPLYGPTGAAIAGLISFWGLMVFGLWYVRQDTIDWKAFLSLFLRGMGAAVLIWLILRFTTQGMSIIFAGLFAGAISVVILLVFGLLRLEDVKHVLSWLRKKANLLAGEPTN